MRKVRVLIVALAAMLAIFTPYGAVSAEFVLVNTSAATIDQLYISPCGGKHWGQNQLADSQSGVREASQFRTYFPVAMTLWSFCRRGMNALFQVLLFAGR